MMNFGWIEWLISYIPKALSLAKQVADLGKETLDTTKSGVEVFETAKHLIKKDASEHPEQTVDRVHALADATRSLAPLAFAEVLFYAVKVTAILVIFKWATNYFSRSDATRMAKKMREEEREQANSKTTRQIHTGRQAKEQA